MNRVVRAQLIRLARPRAMLSVAAGALVFAVVAAVSVFASAESAGPQSRQGGTTVQALSGTGGGTEAFAVGASFAGFLVFVTVIALVAGEFSGGTFRATLLGNPHRLQVIVGKLIGILIVAAAAVALAEVFTLVASALTAPTQDIATAEWFTLGSVGEAVRDYATVMVGVAGWAIFATTLAAVVRSTPLALGVGLAWAGPFENIVVDSWPTGYEVFPGQVLASLIRGGTVELPMSQALVTAAFYIAIAFTVTLVLVGRRDVTA
jgi:ABC-2 type transport system permease protein